MNTPTFEEVFQAAQQLPIADQQLLVELLKPPKTIEQLAEEQGVGPFDFEAARAEATFWPEDENVDDFITALREWRAEMLATVLGRFTVIESSHALCRKWAEVSEQVKGAGRVIHPIAVSV